MKNKLFAALMGAAVSLSLAAGADTVIPVYDKTVYYDGYNSNVFDKDIDDGILRHSNSHYAKRLTDGQLALIGDSLRLDVTLGARCDNYDRIAGFYLALVPKGQETYAFSDVERIEIARYITPFMDKNKKPDTVPYLYDMPGVSLILRDAALREEYDFWLESEVFGVPYAAWQQIAGCKDEDGNGRQDVFDVTARFVTGDPAPATDNNVLVPIYCRKSEATAGGNLNNYDERACDTLGVTSRKWVFNVPEDCEDAKIVFINSNHGANAGGEEYIRRMHIVYYDDGVEMKYFPGGVSCEPYRVYNTQPNGIYSTSRTEDFWRRNSNWCPGQAVPVREIHLGPVKAGEHSFMIRVPYAKFKDKQGDFRPSAYFQGVKKGQVPYNAADEVAERGPEVRTVLSGRVLSYVCADPIADARLYSFDAQLLIGDASPSGTMDLAGLPDGVYIAVFTTADGRSTAAKVIL